MNSKPVLGVALGGGGARGFAHLGVLRTLRAHGIEPTVVTGTSIGALVGAAFACDVLDKFEEVAKRIRARDILSLLSPAWTVRGLFNGDNAVQKLSDLIPVKTIEEMPRRFAAVATDLQRSELVTFTSGDVGRALRASMAVPGVFTPVIEGDRILVDGGILDPVPVAAARALGAERVIAVDLFRAEGMGPLRHRRPFLTTESSAIPRALSRLRPRTRRPVEGAPRNLRTIFDVMVRTLAVSQAHLTTLKLERCPPDLIIAPKVGETGLADFHRAEKVSEAGERACQEALPEILELLASTPT